MWCTGVCFPTAIKARESFTFTVPPGLSAGQPFVVNVSGHGSLLESVPTGMHSERRLQLNYALEPKPCMCIQRMVHFGNVRESGRAHATSDD
jgi:hypothetical protein